MVPETVHPVVTARPSNAVTTDTVLSGPQPHRWNIWDHQKLSDGGFLGDTKTELANGEIVDMAPQKDPHRIGVSRLGRALMAIFDEENYLVTVQSTIRLSQIEAREPDAAVERHLTDTSGLAIVKPLLLVEVSDDSLLSDQIIKGSLYAYHAVPDYWIVNLNARQIEIYRDPVPDASRKYGWRYANVSIVRPPDSVVSLEKPDAPIPAANLLPW